MNLLALETSTAWCSVALKKENIVLERSLLAPRQHSALLLPLIDELLKEANLSLNELNAIAFGQGPGSFIGLRLSASVTQGLAFGSNLPVIPVSTLQILAQTAYEQEGLTAVIAMIEAKVSAVYWGAYQVKEGLMQVVVPDQFSELEKINLSELDLGWERVGNIPALVKHQIYPQARALLTLAEDQYLRGNRQPPEKAVPVYLQDRVVQ